MTGLEKLREIGTHKIFERTHIAKKFVEDILNENFSSMNRVQFAGFLSILEREYNLDLHELSEAYHAQFNTEPSSSEEPFVVSEHNSDHKKGKSPYIAAAVIIAALLVVVFNYSSSRDEKLPDSKPAEIPLKPVQKELNNTAIEEAKLNLSNLEKESVEPEVERVESERTEPVHAAKFEVIPRSKLWIGIVDLETFKRTQKLTSSPFELDADREWLLVMGHGYVNFDVNGEEITFKDEKKVWFAYENGSLTKLSRSEFKEKNRGKAW